MIRAVNPSRKNHEKRAQRVNARIPVCLRNGMTGTTYDISATGIAMELDTNQMPGSMISFSLELDTSGEKIMFVCDAEVVRYEQSNGKIKIGTKIIKQELQPLNRTTLY